MTLRAYQKRAFIIKERVVRHSRPLGLVLIKLLTGEKRACSQHRMMSTVLSLILSLALVAAVSGLRRFTPSRFFASRTSSTKTALDERINTQIEMESAKVVSTLNLVAGEKCVVCRCWKSNKFPLCDGSHVKHNTETGDNVGPAIIVAAPSA